jgi:hypothetical protein
MPMTGVAALLGVLFLAGDLRADGYAGCATCGPAPMIAHNLHAWRAQLELHRGCVDCNPHDPFFCGSTGVNGQNGYCNQRLQHVRRLGVLMNHNCFMGDSWLTRYQGGFNFTPPSPYTRPTAGTLGGG